MNNLLLNVGDVELMRMFLNPNINHDIIFKKNIPKKDIDTVYLFTSADKWSIIKEDVFGTYEHEWERRRYIEDYSDNAIAKKIMVKAKINKIIEGTPENIYSDYINKYNDYIRDKYLRYFAGTYKTKTMCGNCKVTIENYNRFSNDSVAYLIKLEDIELLSEPKGLKDFNYPSNFKYLKDEEVKFLNAPKTR